MLEMSLLMTMIFSTVKKFLLQIEFIIDLINRTNFIVNAKRFIEKSNVLRMGIVHPEEKN